MSLTDFVLPGVVRDLHGVHFKAAVALPDAVDSRDVGTGVIHLLHQLQEGTFHLSVWAFQPSACPTLSKPGVMSPPWEAFLCEKEKGAGYKNNRG